MHLFLIRHGETEHNVAGLLAGVTDSRLTNHGVLQTQRLGKFLADHRVLRFRHIYASDLQRAHMTADAICKDQKLRWENVAGDLEVIRLELLREQDFGSLELAPWASKRVQDAIDSHVPDESDAAFRPKETAQSMTKRANDFLDDFILPILAMVEELENECVAVVSHGLFLSSLWRALLARFQPDKVRLGPDVIPRIPARPLEYIGAWSNTGYLEVEIRKWSNSGESQPQVDVGIEDQTTHAEKLSYSMTILTINGCEHLDNLRRTRGGVGSAAFDKRQKNIEGFFRKQNPVTTTDNVEALPKP